MASLDVNVGNDDANENQELMERARQGDQSAVAELLRRHEPRLKLMVRVRLNPRLRRRLDEDDILQDAYLNAAAQWKRRSIT